MSTRRHFIAAAGGSAALLCLPPTLAHAAPAQPGDDGLYLQDRVLN